MRAPSVSSPKQSCYIFTFNDILEYELFRPNLQAMSSSGLNSYAEDLVEWKETQENLRAHAAARRENGHENYMTD